MHNNKRSSNQKPNVIYSFVVAVVLLLLLSDGTNTLSEAASPDSGGPELEAVLSKSGIRGRFVFSPATSEAGKVKVSARLRATGGGEGETNEYSWGVYQFPVDYSVGRDYCDSRMMGRKPIHNLGDVLGNIVLSSEGETEVEIETDAVQLLGPESIWGRSIVLEGPGKSRSCATIEPVDKSLLRTGEARFAAPIAGSIWFSSLSKGDAVETKIYTNLFHNRPPAKSSDHHWQLFITDALTGNGHDGTGSACDFLQNVYETTKNRDGSGCGEGSRGKCRQGDLGGKFGKVRVGRRESMFTKAYHTDLDLELPDLDGTRSLFVAIYDAEHPDSFMACARLRSIETKVAKAAFTQQGVSGNVEFSQVSPFHPVSTRVSLSGLNGGASGFHVHEFPVPRKRDADDEPCARTAGHFNPFNADKSVSPAAGEGGYDEYEVGDLSGKYGGLAGMGERRDGFVDPSLSLFGRYSIVGRSVVIHKSPVPHRWVCANVELAGARQMLTAVARFTYPVAGQIIFRQDADDPFSDTAVLVDGLLYSDGTKNDSQSHPWHVHTHLPGKDYFNWTGRCLSAKGHFNPYGVDADDNMYNDCVNDRVPLKCELGDLASKHGGLAVAGRKRGVRASWRFFTDSNLPLSGPLGIIGRSVVIHDDHAPEHRGNRMACTAIMRQYRHKAVARHWFGNGIQPPPVKGRLEFIQDTDASLTHSLVDLKGMEAGVANAFHVHQIPVQDQLEFPCTGDAVGGHFNPYNWDASESPKPSLGTPDQYEIGDLSGKYGLLRQQSNMRGIFNDSNLPLFGSQSVVGRSVVVHKKYKAERWACASIGWGFDPDEAREVRAIASFHHPNGFAWGYIRFSQVVYRDGSRTDTSMVVRLKYPGKTNKETTHGHSWSVYVNPVSHDAAVKSIAHRCSAAGYRWNPTHIQLADPMDHGFYGEECGSDYPLRCEVGDLTGRHGKLSVGSKAYVYNDVNLPLSGDWYTSAIGKSIVVHAPNGGGDRMACASIVEDKDIVKYATIRTKARFNLATFMEEVQAVMGVPEWFLYTDSRETKALYGDKCIQIKLHFAGPHANKLEQDFNDLMRTGKLNGPSFLIPGYVPDHNSKKKLSYRECGVGGLGSSPIGSSKRGSSYRYPSSSGGCVTRSHAGLLLGALALALVATERSLW